MTRDFAEDGFFAKKVCNKMSTSLRACLRIWMCRAIGEPQRKNAISSRHQIEAYPANSRGSLKLQVEHLQQFMNMGVDGIVLYSGSFLHDETVNTILSQHIPLVMIDRYYPAITTNVVTTNHYLSGYSVTEHLLRQGHHHMGFILATTEMVTSTLARFEGYKGALRDYGVEFDERLLMKAQIHEETVQAYLKRAGLLTAVFACNDERALEFYAALRSLGLRVPTDLALVGCDDIPVVSQLDPPLTTVAQNVYQLGESTAHLLTETIEGRISSFCTITIQPELVIRQSSRPLPEQDTQATLERKHCNTTSLSDEQCQTKQKKQCYGT